MNDKITANFCDKHVKQTCMTNMKDGKRGLVGGWVCIGTSRRMESGT